MNTEKLKTLIDNSGLKISYIAQSLGISPQGLYKKLNAETEFKASEINSLYHLLGMTTAQRDDIFFAPSVDFKSTENAD